MKIALLFVDGGEQIILTPQSPEEKALLKRLDGRDMKVHHGTFYPTIGGWHRYAEHDARDESTIITLRAAPALPEGQGGGA